MVKHNKNLDNVSIFCRFKEGKELPQLSSEKLQGLGWKYKPLKETLADSVENYKKKGLVNS